MGAACRKIAEGGVPMGDKRADAAHIRLKLLDKLEVTGDMSGGLMGRAYHKSAADLITKLSKGVEALNAVLQSQLAWVKHAVVLGVCRLMPEQVAVGSSLTQAAVAIIGSLAQRQGDGAVGELLLDAPDDTLHPLVGKISVLSPLQHKGAEAEGFALTAAGQDIILGVLAGLLPEFSL